MNDLATVMWKEWRELRAQGDDLGPRTSIVLLIMLLAAVGAISIIAGPFIVRTPMLLVLGYTPVIGVVGVICDSFAGERERHTLETLLASRISSEALLVGKVLLHVVYGMAGMLFLTTIIVVGANVRTITQPWILPTLPIALCLFVVTPLLLLFFSSLGVLVSLRAATVKQAQSKLVLVFLGMFIGPVLLSVLTKNVARPETVKFLISPRGQLLMVGAWILILSAVDVGLIVLAWARFRRDQLIEIR